MSRSDLMMQHVEDGRVQYRREVAGDAAPDFYRYRWLIDGTPAPPPTARLIAILYDQGRVVAGFGGIIGPATVSVMTAEQESTARAEAAARYAAGPGQVHPRELGRRP